MNDFFTDNFNISKINACIFVEKGTGQKIHKNRPFHGLVIELNGIKKYIFDNGKTMEVYPNDVFYLPKFSNYKVENIKAGDCIAVNFELADQNITYPHFVLKQETGKYEKDFQKLLENWNSQKNGQMNLCYMYLYKIICNIQKDFSAQYVPSKTKQLAHKGGEYITQNIGDYTLTVETVSKEIGISPEYFRKIFSDVFGCSPRKFIIDLRMEKAKELILLKEFTIGEISKMCGYDSESYFSSEFKRIVGCTPSEYGKSKRLHHKS